MYNLEFIALRNDFGGVAQSEEHLTVNQGVVGSSPTLSVILKNKGGRVYAYISFIRNINCNLGICCWNFFYVLDRQS